MWIVQLQQAGRLGSKLHHLWLSGLRQRRRQRQTDRDRRREGDRGTERYTETDAETETHREIQRQTQRQRHTDTERDAQRDSVETRSRRHRRRVRGRGGETSRNAAGTGAQCPGAPARLAETRIPSRGFHWKPDSPTGAPSHAELQLKTS